MAGSAAAVSPSLSLPLRVRMLKPFSRIGTNRNADVSARKETKETTFFTTNLLEIYHASNHVVIILLPGFKHAVRHLYGVNFILFQGRDGQN